MGVVSSKTARHTVRIWVFWAWVAASMAIALFAGIVGPFTHYFDEAQPFVAYSVPALMFFMLATGIGWLALMALSKPPRNSPESQDQTGGEAE